jgi:hypothetical protein
MIVQDLSHQTFGRLWVIEKNKKNKWKNWEYWCLCECGNIKSIAGGNLLNGSTTSCGCLRDEKVGNLNRKHNGRTKHLVEYIAWKHMLGRCYNPNEEQYENWGGRGIAVCAEWRYSFLQFLKDMGPRPGPGYSLDRIDNDGNYCKENCRWATRKEQMNNTRRQKKLTFNNQTKLLTEWSLIVGISYLILYRRYFKWGWNEEQTFLTPRGIGKMRIQNGH